MSTFTRLWNLIKGMFSSAVSKAENDNPEIVFHNAIQDQVERYSKARHAIASMVVTHNDIKSRLVEKRKSYASIEAALEVALEQDDDDAAVYCIQEKERLESLISDLENDDNQAAAAITDAKESLDELEKQIKQLESERDFSVAKLQSAKARRSLQDSIDGLSIDGNAVALDNVRKEIKTTVAEAELQSELKKNNIEKRLSRIQRKTGDVTARKKLEELKAARRTKEKVEVEQELQELANISTNK